MGVRWGIEERSALRFAQPIEPFLHIVKLAFEIIDLVARACRRRLFSLAGLGLVSLLSPGEMKWISLIQIITGWIHAILLIHIVAWLSLTMKRGALPLGYVIAQAFGMLISIASLALAALTSFASSSGSMAYFALNPLISGLTSLAAAFILHRRCLPRLETLAGEA